MDEQKLREERINKNLNLNKLPGRLKQKSSRALGAEISNFIHHVFIERAKSQSLNWCFDNIKRVFRIVEEMMGSLVKNIQDHFNYYNLGHS